MELKGEKLLDKIRSLHDSINLLTYRGNLREVAVECGYIRKDRIQRKDISRKMNYPEHILQYPVFTISILIVY